MSKEKPKPVIFAYGFEEADFIVPKQPIETPTFVIRFVDYSTLESLESADGIITPSGIFEEYETSVDFMGQQTHQMSCDIDRLAKREKEVSQSFRRGGWIAFLLRSVDNRWQKTDLTKRFLNLFFERVTSHDPDPHVDCKADEFSQYLHDFGISRTSFWLARSGYNPRVIAGNRNQMDAAEVLGQFFFLPLPSIQKNEASVVNLVTKCAEAVLEYKRRNDLHLPAWVENIEFSSENKLRVRISELETQIVDGQKELAKWRRYKAILSASGNKLSTIVVDILRDYFGLDLHSKEEFIEDAIIYDGQKPLFVVEIKGVNAGLKRDHVNQVDSHRERLGLSPETPGLLIINDFSDIDELAARKAKTFDSLHLRHAEKLNIRILRTTILLEIMLAYESEAERTRKFLELCECANPMAELAVASPKSAASIPTKNAVPESFKKSEPSEQSPAGHN